MVANAEPASGVSGNLDVWLRAVRGGDLGDTGPALLGALSLHLADFATKVDVWIRAEADRGQERWPFPPNKTKATVKT